MIFPAPLFAAGGQICYNGTSVHRAAFSAARPKRKMREDGPPMLFSSLVFLWIFLPVVLVVYRLVPGWGKNALLLAVSLFFYAWGEPVYILLMLASITLNYLGGLALAPFSGRGRSLVLAAVVAANLALLGYYKYYGFAADTLAGLLGRQVLPMRDIALPLGISFYTFQAMSYVIDLYRRRIEPQKNWFLLALYISFFPQLVAGPIVRYTDVQAQLRSRAVTAQSFAFGTKRFLYGLAKKVILANCFAAKADEVFALDPAGVGTAVAWLGALYYGLQIYYDFSGYSDMAIGLGAMFGFTFPENFDYPYLSASIGEFWRRWHMTLSSWFKEYLYIPLGGNRKGQLRTLFNVCVVFLATGLWHGASWQFVAWGAWYALLQVLERTVLKKPLAKAPKPLARVYTLLCVLFGWVIFRAPGLRAGLLWLKAMVVPAAGFAAWPVSRYIDGRTLVLLAAGLLLCGPAQALWPRFKAALYDRRPAGWAQTAVLLALGFACLVLLVSGTYNPFIYFRF